MILWGEIRCLSLIGVKGFTSHGLHKATLLTVLLMLKKNQEQSQLEVKSAGRLVLLPDIYFVLCSWARHIINYKSLLFGKVCCACWKKSVKKKAMLVHFREFLEWLQCPAGAPWVRHSKSLLFELWQMPLSYMYLQCAKSWQMVRYSY